MTKNEKLFRRAHRFALEHQPTKLTLRMPVADREVIVDFLAHAWRLGYETAKRDARRTDNG